MGNHGPMDGWQIFRVKSAVLDWIEDSSSSSQLEFWVTAVTALSQPVHLRVSRRRDRHANHQPVLVLFNDVVSSAPSSNSFPVIPESAGVTTEHLTRNIILFILLIRFSATIHLISLISLKTSSKIDNSVVVNTITVIVNI